MKSRWLTAAAFGAATLTISAPARADVDPIVFWNQILTQNVTGSPVLTSRSYSMVEVAMFEAINSTTGNTHQSYLGLGPSTGNSKGGNRHGGPRCAPQCIARQRHPGPRRAARRHRNTVSEQPCGHPGRASEDRRDQHRRRCCLGRDPRSHRRWVRDPRCSGLHAAKSGRRRPLAADDSRGCRSAGYALVGSRHALGH